MKIRANRSKATNVTIAALAAAAPTAVGVLSAQPASAANYGSRPVFTVGACWDSGFGCVPFNLTVRPYQPVDYAIDYGAGRTTFYRDYFYGSIDQVGSNGLLNWTGPYSTVSWNNQYTKTGQFTFLHGMDVHLSCLSGAADYNQCHASNSYKEGYWNYPSVQGRFQMFESNPDTWMGFLGQCGILNQICYQTWP